MNIESFEKGIRLPFRRTMIASLLGAGLLTAAAAQAQERAGNPFVGASSYLNPDYTKDVNFSI
jgi:cellulose 1,4-beta-cellobiosidase